MSYDLLTINNGTADVNFERRSFVGSEVFYHDVAATVTLPQILRVSARTAKNPTATSDTLVSVSRSVEDSGADVFTARIGKVHVVFARPQDGVVTDADMTELWTMLKNSVDANLSAILNGGLLQ